MIVHVHKPRGVLFRRVQRCQNCKARRRFIERRYGWYSPDLTCLGCGDVFSDGERLRRPAVRGWRSAAIKKAKYEWQLALPRPEAERELSSIIGFPVGA